jgi:hypothetical protein
MEFKCEICNKQYSSRQSRWNHIKKYHSSTECTLPPKTTKCTTKSHQNDDIIFCSLCNKNFTRKDALTRHLNDNRCKKNKEKKIINDLQKKIEDLTKFQKEEMEKIKLELQKALKIHPPDLLEKSLIFLIKSDRPN